MSVPPAPGLPEIDGGVEFAGGVAAGAWTTAVAAELTGPAEPAVFDAVTATTIVDPTSAATSVYVDPVCPAIALHELPELSQRNH